MPQRYQRPYPPEFRREAVELYRRSGRPLREIAVDLGVVSRFTNSGMGVMSGSS